MKQLRRIRQDQGIRQKDLAAKCGIRPATICDLERGKIKNPRVDTLRKIASALGVSLESLFDTAA